MTKVAIVPVMTEQGSKLYHAVAGMKQSAGATAGAALDALTDQLSAEESSTLVIVQSFRSDQFFSTTQQQRLAELMQQWRTARDTNVQLPAYDQAELEELIEKELVAASQRAAILADNLGE